VTGLQAQDVAHTLADVAVTTARAENMIGELSATTAPEVIMSEDVMSDVRP
jgi:hypothetical protein